MILWFYVSEWGRVWVQLDLSRPLAGDISHVLSLVLTEGLGFFNPKWVLGNIPIFCETIIGVGSIYASCKNQDLWLRPVSVILRSLLMLHISCSTLNAMQGNLLCCATTCMPRGLSFGLFWELAMSNSNTAWLQWWLWSQLAFQLSSKRCVWSIDYVVIG